MVLSCTISRFIVKERRETSFGLTFLIIFLLLPGNFQAVVHASNTPSCGPFADFVIYPSYGSIVVPPGGSAMTSISLMPVLGLSDTITLSTLNVPPGLSTVIEKSALDLAPVLQQNRINITVSASSTMLQGDYYYFDVRATSSHGISHDARVYVQVSQRMFSLYANPKSLSLPSNALGNISLFITPSHGFADTVDLVSTISLQPPGATPPSIVLSPASIAPSAFGLDGKPGSVLTVTTSSTTTSGYYQVQIVGAAHLSPEVAESSIIDLRVGSGFVLSAQPEFSVVQQCSTQPVTVTITSVEGFEGRVTVNSTWDTFSPMLHPIISPLSQTVTVSPGSPGKYVLNISPTLDDQPNPDYSLILTGTSGYQNNITFVRITVAEIANRAGLLSLGLEQTLFYVLLGTAILAAVVGIIVLQMKKRRHDTLTGPALEPQS